MFLYRVPLSSLGRLGVQYSRLTGIPIKASLDWTFESLKVNLSVIDRRGLIMAKIALVQRAPVVLDKSKSIEKVVNIINELGEQSVELAVFPDYSTSNSMSPPTYSCSSSLLS